MSIVAKFAAKKAAASSTPFTPTASRPTSASESAREVESLVETPAQIHKPTPEAAPKRTFARRLVEVVAEVVKPEPVKVAPQARAVVTFDPFSIITGQGGEDASSVLEMILAKTEEDGDDRNFDGVFPLVKLLKGNSGGSWTFGSNVDGASAAVLPVAKNPFTAIFLGYRLYGVAWETSMIGHAASGGDDKKSKPLWKVQIASSDKALVSAALEAGEAYQFCKGTEKGAKYDGLGHFRPGVEMLFYREGIVFAVRLPDHYSTTIRSLEALGSVMRGLGGLKAVPVTVTPYSTDEKGATPWKCHALRIEFAASAGGKALAQEFDGIKADMVADAEFGPTFAEWNTTVIEDDAAAALKEIASTKKGR